MTCRHCQEEYIEDLLDGRPYCVNCLIKVENEMEETADEEVKGDETED